MTTKLKLYLSISISINVFKRYYPGCKDLSLSKGNCRRILNIFNKNNILTDRYPIPYINQTINNLYEIQGRNRTAFIESIRQVANNKVIFSRKSFDHPLFFTTINTLAEMTRLYNISTNSIELSAQQINEKQGKNPPLRSVSLEEKRKAKQKEIADRKAANLKLEIEAPKSENKP